MVCDCVDCHTLMRSGVHHGPRRVLAGSIHIVQPGA